MSYHQIYAIAAEAMSIETTRIKLVANNIANQYSIKNADGDVFQAQSLKTHAKSFSDWINSDGTGIESMEIVSQNLPPNKVWQPEHPDADKTGYVTYPGISTVDEMTTLLLASRAYEASVKVFNTAHTLCIKALTIGEER